MTPSVCPWLLVALLLPAATALVTLGWREDAAASARRARSAALVAASALTLAASLACLPEVLRGAPRTLELLRLTPQVPLALRVDALGALYGTCASALWLLAVIYALGYLHGPNQARTYAALMVCLSAAMGVAYAGNLLTFLVFYELLSVLTYLLIIHDQTPPALAAGLKYIAYVLVGGSLVLAGVLLTFANAGDLTFRAGGLFGPDAAAQSGTLVLTFACFVLGFGVKAALMPLHAWVADAHPAAPAPCSALLSGVLVAAGGIGLIRVSFEVLGPQLLDELGVMRWLGLAAGVTVVTAALLALQQDDLKRRLAYSTVSQMGYLTLALSLLGPLATLGALVHLVHHAFMKGALFFCAGSFAYVTRRRGMASLAGLAARTPLTAAAFALVTLGMIGVPPLSGFVSKWWLGLGMLEADAPAALVVLLVGALLAAGYLLPVVYTLYFGRAGDASGASVAATPPATDATAPAAVATEPAATASASDGEVARRAYLVEHRAPPLIAIVLAAGATVVLGLAADGAAFPVALARQAVSELFGGV